MQNLSLLGPILLLLSCTPSQRELRAAASMEDRCWQACYERCAKQVRSEYVPCATNCRRDCAGCSGLQGVEPYCACVLVYGEQDDPACDRVYLQ